MRSSHFVHVEDVLLQIEQTIFLAALFSAVTNDGEKYKLFLFYNI